MNDILSEKGQVLIVDHKPDLYLSITELAKDTNYEIEYADRLQGVFQRISSQKFDIVLLREHLPDGDVCEAVEKIKKGPEAPAIIVVGSAQHVDSIKNLFDNGVWDYVPEFESPSTFFSSFKKIIDYLKKSREHNKHLKKVSLQLKNKGIIGNSQVLQNCLDSVVKVGPLDVNVLISGESGTGKELFAQALHAISPRSAREMVVVDCASLPDNLVESILFGHVKGAFTSADRSSEGLFGKSHGSTLFLDEIGELPLEMQKKFLRVLQERCFRPVGSNKTVPVDFRLIAASNKNLQELNDNGLFREDLFFRLKTFEVHLPPLRDRKSDIPELAYFFLDNYCREKRLERKKFSPEYLVVLCRYQWPGNVRELFNVIERSIAAAMDTETLLPIHLPINVRVQAIDNFRNDQKDFDTTINSTILQGPSQQIPTLQETRNDAIKKIEKRYLNQLLDSCGGDKEKACEISGLSRSRLYALLKKYSITL